MEEILKILVVDDDEVDRIAVRRALKAAGVRMQLLEAGDCATALATIQQHTFDCVFLDYLLPDGDGLTLVKQMRQAGVKVPLVVLTGQGDEQIAVELMKAGASDYLSKAKVSPENLSKSLRSVIRLYQAEKEAALANQRRQESEERYRLVLEGANDGIWDWYIPDNKIYWNDRLFEITGLSLEEFEGTYEAFCSLMHPEDKPGIMDAVHIHLEHNVAFNVELRLRHVSGEYRYCIARAKAQRDAWGVPFRMSGTITDITERKQAEEALRFLAEASSVLAVSLDYKTTLASIARLVVPTLADCCFFDVLTADEKSQRVAWQHVDPDKREWFDRVQHYVPSYPFKHHPAANVLLTGKATFVPEVSHAWMQEAATSEEHFQFMRDLQLRSLMTVPLIAHDRKLGTLTFCLVAESGRNYTKADLALAEDLGRRAAIAIENARLYYEAQEANRMKDEFLATLSHELRTPLNAMLGWAQLLKSRKLDEEKTVRALETIERNARSQTQMIEDLLDVSRIITGKLRLNFRACELVPLIEAALDSVRPAAAAKSIEIQSFLDPQVSSVAGDSNRLQQIIWNLLSNAVKFTPNGGRVEVRLEQFTDEYLSRSYVQIQVKDTGIGISADFLPYVFERFRQADSTTARAYNGLGLGLAIVRHLVELHGGTVYAASPGEGQGSMFTVQMPTTFQPSTVAPQPAAASIQPSVVNTQLYCLDGLRVLVVDDEADTRELLSVMLKQYGADVMAVSSAGEALLSLEKLKPDVLVSDIGMPFEDGYSLMRRIRALEAQHGGQVPAVALTAYARESDRSLALKAGFQLHVPKPVEPTDLAAAVAKLVGRSA